LDLDSAAAPVQIAVADVDGPGFSKSERAAVSDKVAAQLHATGLCRIVERSRVDAVLAEQGFQQLGVTDIDSAVKIGRILNVQALVLPGLRRAGPGLALSIRVVDVATGSAMDMVTSNCDRCGIAEVMDRTVPKAVRRLTLLSSVADRRLAVVDSCIAKARGAAVSGPQMKRAEALFSAAGQHRNKMEYARFSRAIDSSAVIITAVLSSSDLSADAAGKRFNARHRKLTAEARQFELDMKDAGDISRIPGADMAVFQDSLAAFMAAVRDGKRKGIETERMEDWFGARQEQLDSIRNAFWAMAAKYGAKRKD
jgi:hypothetical protein